MPVPTPMHKSPDDGAALLERRLAMGLVALWLVGAALAHFVGVWMGIGSSAILLGAAVMAAGSRAGISGRLRPSLRLVALGVAAGGVMIVVCTRAGAYWLAARGWVGYRGRAELPKQGWARRTEPAQLARRARGPGAARPGVIEASGERAWPARRAGSPRG